MTVDGAVFRYVLAGREGARTLVFLNGGMNTLEMWMDYVDALSDDYQVLLFDYPQALRTNQALAAGLRAFFDRLGVEKPIFIGASDGGMVAQIYAQKYPGAADGLILISTGGMDAATLRSLRRKYFLAPLMLWYMKRCNDERLKPRLISAGLSHLRDEGPEEIACARDMFETIFKDYTREKDVHISGLPADLMNQRPVTAADFEPLAGRCTRGSSAADRGAGRRPLRLPVRRRPKPRAGAVQKPEKDLTVPASLSARRGCVFCVPRIAPPRESLQRHSRKPRWAPPYSNETDACKLSAQSPLRIAPPRASRFSAFPASRAGKIPHARETDARKLSAQSPPH